MLIKCNECNAEISDESKNCVKCGSPISKKESPLETFYGIVGIAIFVFAAYGVYQLFFSSEDSEISSSEVLITDQSLSKSLIGNMHTLSFYAKNTGPKSEYEYYIQIGDHWYNRIISDKFCKGDFVLEKDEEKFIEITCKITIPVNRYSLVVD
jgi:hypothetical protein